MGVSAWVITSGSNVPQSPGAHHREKQIETVEESASAGRFWDMATGVHRVIVWPRLDVVGVEYAEVESDPLRLEGEVILADGDGPCVVSYRVDCNGAGQTTRALVRVKRPGGLATRTLERAADGSWT